MMMIALILLVSLASVSCGTDGSGTPEAVEPQTNSSLAVSQDTELEQIDGMISNPKGHSSSHDVDGAEIETENSSHDVDGAEIETENSCPPLFPEHWGQPPMVQTRDIRTLPKPYDACHGSSTLYGWILAQQVKDRDAKPTN